MIVLRDYQEKGRYHCNRQLNQYRNPLFVMGAGTGKTKMATVIIQDRISLKKRLLVLVPQLEIFSQWIIECAENDINYGYINDEGVIGRNRDVYISMYQSLSNLLHVLPEKFVKSFNEIITDECHRGMATSYRNIYEHFSHCLRVGLTASPYRMDGQSLGEFYDSLYEPIKNSEAIKKGYLCPPAIIIPEKYKNCIPEDPESANINEQKKLIEDKRIIGDMVQTYKDVFNGLPVVVPCSSYKHAVVVKEMYQNAGWICDHIHSGLSKFDRKAILKRVRTGKTNILLSVGIGVEGLDIAGLYGIIFLRLTESLTIWIQFCGRAARPFPGKKHYILIDPMGNTVLFGSPALDRKWSLTSNYVPGQDTDDIKMRICPNCKVVNSSELLNCWICRYEFATGTIDGHPVDKKQRRLPRMIDGNLVYLDGNDPREQPEPKVINKKESVINNVDNSVELSRADKVAILRRDIFKRKNKFSEGLKWL